MSITNNTADVQGRRQIMWHQNTQVADRRNYRYLLTYLLNTATEGDRGQIGMRCRRT